MHQRLKSLSHKVKCPACQLMMDGNAGAFLKHFEEIHQRKPTDGELFQLRSYKKRDSRNSPKNPAVQTSQRSIPPKQTSTKTQPLLVNFSVATGVFNKTPTRLEDVSIEYQAFVYAQMEKKRLAKIENNRQKNLESLRQKLQVFKEKLQSPQTEASKVGLEKEIRKLEKIIEKMNKPKRNWSPVLPGSFEFKK